VTLRTRLLQQPSKVKRPGFRPTVWRNAFGHLANAEAMPSQARPASRRHYDGFFSAFAFFFFFFIAMVIFLLGEC
jgi:hypothetical protein